MTARIGKTAKVLSTDLQPAFFYESAREGMADMLSNVLTTRQQGVLLPAFIGWSPREGSGVFDPIVDAETPAGFYNLNSDLSVDYIDLERRLSAGKFRVLVVIHYFGRTEPRIAAIRTLADRWGVLLVEDLAHGFFSSRAQGGAGSYGDACLFSLHKLFPFEGGGMVTYRDSTLIDQQQSSAPDYAARILSYDWSAISETRQNNFRAVTSALSASKYRDVGFELMWPELVEGDVPQTLPVKILGGERDRIYFGMNNDGFGMVSLYHTLIADIGDEFESLVDLSRHIINFPVHQDMSVDQVNDLVASFDSHLGSE